MKDDLMQVSSRAFLLGLLLVSLNCASSTSRGDGAATPAQGGSAAMGTGCNDLVVITASNTSDGIDAEYAWIKEHLPGYQREGQRLGRCEDTMIDVIELVGPDGESREVYFDISSFFGKY